MKVRIRGSLIQRLPRLLNYLHATTLVAGAGLAAWPAFVFLESAYAQWDGERVLAAAAAPNSGPVAQQETIVPESRAVRPDAAKIARGAVLGRFEMPRLGLSYVLLEGTDNRTLDKSIGRVQGTALPGEPGNIGIAGHRNTHFRKLEWVRRGDDIILTTPKGEYRYKVEWTHLYEPTTSQVLSPASGPSITLVTCFPFEYVGSAPLRFVVRALPDEATRAKLELAPQTTAGQP